MTQGKVPVSLDVGSSFAALARDLRRAGAGGLRKELYSALQREARPAIAAARAGASRLPQRGGLAQRVAGASFKVRPATPAMPSIRITATERKGGSMDPRALDEGRVRHPVFGKWRRGVRTQRVPTGWFTDPLTEHAEGFEKALRDAIDRIEGDISGG